LGIILDLSEAIRGRGSQGMLNRETVALESSFSFQGQNAWEKRPFRERLFSYSAYPDFLLPPTGSTRASVCPYHYPWKITFKGPILFTPFSLLVGLCRVQVLSSFSL
jgi:hypothetical protein